MKLSFSRKAIWVLALAGMSLGAAVIVSGAAASTKKIQVCALLPDTTTSGRVFTPPPNAHTTESAGDPFTAVAR